MYSRKYKFIMFLLKWIYFNTLLNSIHPDMYVLIYTYAFLKADYIVYARKYMSISFPWRNKRLLLIFRPF
jgi:hypothetical protein